MLLMTPILPPPILPPTIAIWTITNLAHPSILQKPIAFLLRNCLLETPNLLIPIAVLATNKLNPQLMPPHAYTHAPQLPPFPCLPLRSLRTVRMLITLLKMIAARWSSRSLTCMGAMNPIEQQLSHGELNTLIPGRG